MDYLQLGLDLTSVDIGCDGNTGDAQHLISQFTDFPAMIELLKQQNDWKTTTTFPCFKERKFVDAIDNYKDQIEEPSRRQQFNEINFEKCREKCILQSESACRICKYPPEVFQISIFHVINSVEDPEYSFDPTPSPSYTFITSTTYSLTHTTTSTTSTLPLLKRSARLPPLPPLPGYYNQCDEFNLCIKQCHFYPTKCTLASQYFAHCPEFGFCYSSDSKEEGKDVNNEVISTNTKQMLKYVESSKAEK